MFGRKKKNRLPQVKQKPKMRDNSIGDQATVLVLRDGTRRLGYQRGLSRGVMVFEDVLEGIEEIPMSFIESISRAKEK